MTEQEPETQDRTGASLTNHLGILLFKFFEWVIKLVPLSVVCRVGMAAGHIAYFLIPSRRKIVARNLRIVINPKLRGKELARLVRQNFVRTTMNMLASTKTATMTVEELKQCTELDGPDAFADPDTQAHGLVCLVGHCGNWELLSHIDIFMPAASHFGSMYRKMENPLLEDYLYTKRTNNGSQMFSKENGVQAPISFLKSGGGLGVLSDQFVQEGYFVPYFGKITGTTYLPALMQKRTKAKIKPFITTSPKPGRWICHSNDGISTDDGKSSLFETTIAANRLLEELIAKAPLDAFWMHHRWKASECFAPQDAKTAKVLEQLDLKPFRILFATPPQFDEALLCVPVVKALRGCRCDMQVTVICPEEQVEFWKTIPEATYVVAQGTPKALETALFTPELYDDGPIDNAFLFDNSPGTVKALEKLMPISFTAFSSHPCSKQRAFKTVLPAVSPGPVKHRISDYLRVLDRHQIPYENPDYFPKRKQSSTQPGSIAIAPFSTLGEACEWDEDKWSELTASLPEKTTATLIALPQDRERAEKLASKLGISSLIGTPVELLDKLASIDTVITVDGLIPALSAHSGTPCVTLFSTRLPARFRPLGSFHQSLHCHRSCSPCFLGICDQRTKCVNDITPQQVLNAYTQTIEHQ